MNISRIIFSSKKLSLWGSVVFLLIFYAFLYKIYIPRITAFGCFDDCFNFMGGYFLLSGKHLFSQIFYNHAPLMAYISMAIQGFTHPQNLYELILRHRQFVLLFGLVSEILLVFRFGKIILLFTVLYELTKWYLFGDRFLAEGLIVYPLVYMFAVFIEQQLSKKVFTPDLLIAAICTWFVVFSREPYAPIALLLFILLFLRIKNRQYRLWSFIILFVFSSVTLFTHNVNDFIYNVFTINKGQVHIASFDSFKSFLYPFLLIFQNSWTFFGRIEFGLSVIFLLLSGYFLLRKKYHTIIVVWIILGVTNLRYTAPGYQFYAAFHMLPWYALFLSANIFLLFSIRKKAKILFIVGLFILTTILASVFTKASYIRETVNQQTEFIDNYGIPMQVGNVVHALSQSTDTLFVDGFDDIIYFVAHRYSPYQYSWYTSIMPDFSLYTNARIAMFRKNPPAFYYGSCPKENRPYYLLPDFIKDNYVRLYNQEKPSCLWINKAKLPQITNAQWQKAGEQLYYVEPHS